MSHGYDSATVVPDRGPGSMTFGNAHAPVDACHHLVMIAVYVLSMGMGVGVAVVFVFTRVIRA